LQVTAPEAESYRAVETLFDPNARTSQAGSNILAINLVDSAFVPDRIVVGDTALLNMAENRRQFVLFV
jgi:hypothetical protein